MAHSLKNQGEQAIFGCIAYGESKRSAKRSGDQSVEWKIYSINHRNGLIDTNADMMRFIKANYPDCRFIRDVKMKMIQAYIDEKAKTCNKKTMTKILSHIKKLEKCYRHKYSGVKLKTDSLRMPETEEYKKARSKAMGEDIYQTLLNNMSDKTEARKAVMLCWALGLRIAEAANLHMDERISFTGGKYGFGTATIKGKTDGAKGGRWRTIDILSADDQQIIRECMKGVRPGHTLIKKADGTPYKADSLLRAMERAAQKAGIAKEWTQNKGHALRKGFAQRCWDTMRQEMDGQMPDEAARKLASQFVNEQLGHSEDRKGLIKIYVQDPW